MKSKVEIISVQKNFCVGDTRLSTPLIIFNAGRPAVTGRRWLTGAATRVTICGRYKGKGVVQTDGKFDVNDVTGYE